MSKTFNTRMKFTRDTSANWTQNNPVLLNGEIVLVDTDAGELRAKIGDGTKTYTQLPFSDEILRNIITTVAERIVPVDSQLSETSTNSIQNKVVTASINNLSIMLGDKSVSTQITEAMASKVDKVDGKALSTNDYTTAEKTKLSNIEAGANKTVVDSSVSTSSNNPVSSAAVATYVAEQIARIADYDMEVF